MSWRRSRLPSAACQSFEPEQPQCIIGCIAHQFKPGCAIGRLNDLNGGQGLLEAIKNLSAFVTEDELNIVLQQVGQWKGLLTEVLDEAPVKPCMTKKRTNLSYKRGVRQL